MDFTSMPYEQLRAFMNSMDSPWTQLMANLAGPPPAGSAPPAHLEIDGIDGHRVPIDIYRASGKLPQIRVVMASDNLG